MDIRDVIYNPQFWLAIAFAFIISLVIAVIVQDVWDTFKAIDDEIEYEVSDEQLNIGCTVYDIVHDCAGIYCGTDDDSNAVVVLAHDNVIHILKCEPENLLTLREQA